MGRNALLIVFFFLMVLLLLTFTSQGLFVLERVAVIDQLEGRAEVIRSGGGRGVEAKIGLPVKTGDTVVTGRDSWLRLHWADGTTMRIGPNSKVEVRKCHFNTSSRKEESLFSLTVGSVLASIRKRLSSGSFFEVETPVVVAGVRGTRFMVRMAGGRCSVSVNEGNVEVRSGRARTVVPAGQGADIPRKGRIERRPMRADEERTWREELPRLLAPYLRISRPNDGAVVGLPEVEVSGTTDPFATLIVGGRKVRPDRTGKFRAKVGLKRGTNVIEVVADDGQGHRTVKFLTVHFGKPARSRSEASLRLSVEPPVIPADGTSSAVVEVFVLIKGEPAPDGTPVALRASRGSIPDHALTKGGVATAVYRAPLGPPGRATIRASCYGAEGAAEVRLVGGP